MTVRCSSRFSTLLFCLPFLGLCFATTAWGASDDDDEEWHDTKGPSSERGDSSDKKTEEPTEKKSRKDSEERGSDEERSSEKKSGTSDAKSKTKGDTTSTSSDLNVSFAALGSYGVSTPQHLGLGLRGGYHWMSVLPLYFGGVGQYFFGSQSSTKDFGDTKTRTLRFMYFGAEGGVSVDPIADITIRPYVGLGLGLNKDETCSNSDGCSGGTELNLTITPGVVGLYRIDSFFLGPDLRYIIVPGGGLASGIAISATAGLSL